MLSTSSVDSASTATSGTRVVLAKVGLDGHDRGIKVVARGLRDAGFHVIYSGLWQSPEAVAQIVADEDAAWLGISFLNGAHLSLVPRVVNALRDIGRSDVGLIVGGIIPPADIPELGSHGVRAFFGPGTTIAEISRALSPPIKQALDLDMLFDKAKQQDHAAIAKLLTAVSSDEYGDEIRSRFAALDSQSRRASDLATRNPSLSRVKNPLTLILSPQGRGEGTGESQRSNVVPEGNPASDTHQTKLHRIAVTGSPGVGKSSLIAGLIKSILAQSTCRIAVLACDPESPVTGGALLGDRLRMVEFIPNENLFIHSLATPSGLQGVAPNLDVMGQIIAWAGFDLLIVETVGIGQGEIAVRSIADQVILVLQPQTGDSVQWDKAGLWELADMVVVQKCDLPGADNMLVALREQLTRPDGTAPPIVGVSSHTQAGWDQLLGCLGELMLPCLIGCGLG